MVKCSKILQLMHSKKKKKKKEKKERNVILRHPRCVLKTL